MTEGRHFSTIPSLQTAILMPGRLNSKFIFQIGDKVLRKLLNLSIILMVYGDYKKMESLKIRALKKKKNVQFMS